jgi:hypothetical protein
METRVRCSRESAPALTCANVVAMLVRFIAPGGTSVAASSPISGGKVERGSIPADRIERTR